jgi:hypothetical protein
MLGLGKKRLRLLNELEGTLIGLIDTDYANQGLIPMVEWPLARGNLS